MPLSKNTNNSSMFRDTTKVCQSRFSGHIKLIKEEFQPPFVCWEWDDQVFQCHSSDCFIVLLFFIRSITESSERGRQVNYTIKCPRRIQVMLIFSKISIFLVYVLPPTEQRWTLKLKVHLIPLQSSQTLQLSSQRHYFITERGGFFWIRVTKHLTLEFGFLRQHTVINLGAHQWSQDGTIIKRSKTCLSLCLSVKI